MDRMKITRLVATMILVASFAASSVVALAAPTTGEIDASTKLDHVTYAATLPDEPSPEAGFESIADNLVIVLLWQPATQTWDLYFPITGDDTIGTLELNRAYFVYVESDCTLMYGSRVIGLYAGWNNPVWLGSSPAVEDTTITLEDGASISIPPGAVSDEATVTAKQLDPDEGPETPEGFKLESLYEFTVDEPLMEPVTLRLPLVAIMEDQVLWVAKYDQVVGGWQGVSFTVEDGYAVVETDTLSFWSTMRGTWDDFTDWAAKTGGSFQSWYREEVFPWLTTDHYISWFEEVSGLDKMIYEPLFATSPELICDHSQSRNLISASARLMSEDRIEIRIRNDTKMYLHLYFDGPSFEPIQRGYLSLADVLRFVETTHDMKSVVESSFLAPGVILLPECTADFRTYMRAGETLHVRAELSNAAALLNGLEPAFALVPVADLEALSAVRDLKGAESDFYNAMLAYEAEWRTKTYQALNIVRETLRAGWMLGTKGLQTLVNMALAGVPAATGLADRAVGIAEEILDKGQDAILGGKIIFSYLDVVEPDKHSLAISSTRGGSVVTPGEGTFNYDASTLVSLAANPASGYRFVRWTGDVDTIADVEAAETTITMNDSYSITANFEETGGYTPMVAAGSSHTVGLKSDGTVVAVGGCWRGECDLGEWTDIVQITAGGWHTVGLKSDGTVVAAGRNEDGQCNVADWNNIIQISAGYHHTVGLKSDGTVVAVGRNDDGQCNVSDWTDIVQVAAEAGSHTVGLKADGTVVAVGYCSFFGECDVGDWTDIIQIAAGGQHTVGLKSDGTVVGVGRDGYGESSRPSQWAGIVQVVARSFHTVGLESHGTVVIVGGCILTWKCRVGDWTDIVHVAMGSDHTVGLKSDGTVVAVGPRPGEVGYYGQCNVGTWNLGATGP